MMTNNIILVLSGLTVAATLCEALTLPLIHKHSIMSPIEPTMHGHLTNQAFGEYLMPLRLGTPPVDILANADTGGSLTWTQCSPCRRCYHQLGPKFNRTASSTFRALHSSESACKKIRRGKKREDAWCRYKINYGDSSMSKGLIARERLELGGDGASFPNFIMGCGNVNKGKFSPYGSGIVGLGYGPYTFIDQLGESADGKFSYCLAEKQPNSKAGGGGYIRFAKDSVVSGRGVVSTPFHLKKHRGHYYLTINAITVGNIRVPLKLQARETGNMLIDSGSSHFKLPLQFYKKLKLEIKSQLKEAGAKRAHKVNGKTLCYWENGFHAPQIVLNFEGANVTLNEFNWFLPAGNGAICSILKPSDDDMFLLGNVAQKNFQIGYDWGEKRVYFKPTDCGAA